MRYVTVQEILFIHFRLIEQFVGAHGVLNLTGLESAIARPQATMAGDDLYSSGKSRRTTAINSVIFGVPRILPAPKPRACSRVSLRV